ncbi:MAG: ABC transporter permease [Treponema sp.]|nr:ABC transporter permease [Treponema sp.]
MRFALRRIGSALITVFLVSLFSFLAFGVVSGDAAVHALGIDATEEQIARLWSELGLDRNPAVRYLAWLGGIFSGDWGESVRFRGERVAGLVAERLPVTFSLASLALILTLLIAVPTSLVSVRREGGIVDRMTGVLTACGLGIPGFFLGILLIWGFGIGLRLFSVGAYVDHRENVPAFLLGLLPAALAVAIPNAAILAKFLRESLFREQRADYFRTARGKGSSRPLALYRHALRNALIPAVTVLGMILGETLSGSIIVEQVFSLPGVGRLLVASIASRDFPVVQALVVLAAVLVILANTLVDIAIRAIDPRIGLEGRRR